MSTDGILEYQGTKRVLFRGDTSNTGGGGGGGGYGKDGGAGGSGIVIIRYLS